MCLSGHSAHEANKHNNQQHQQVVTELVKQVRNGVTSITVIQKRLAVNSNSLLMLLAWIYEQQTQPQGQEWMLERTLQAN